MQEWWICKRCTNMFHTWDISKEFFESIPIVPEDPGAQRSIWLWLHTCRAAQWNHGMSCRKMRKKRGEKKLEMILITSCVTQKLASTSRGSSEKVNKEDEQKRDVTWGLGLSVSCQFYVINVGIDKGEPSGIRDVLLCSNYVTRGKEE